jgi:hypothetical protein
MSQLNSSTFVRASSSALLVALVIVTAGLGLRLSHLISFVQWAYFLTGTCVFFALGFACARFAMSKCSREQEQAH